MIEYKLSTAADTAYSETLPTNAGTYTARFKVEGNEDYGSLLSTIEFTIETIKITIPAKDNREFVYTGEAQTYTVALNDAYTVDGAAQTNAGLHTVTITLKDTANYEWTDGSTDALEYDFVIAQADNSWLSGPTATSWIYGGDKIAAKASAKFGTVKVEYKLSTAADTAYSETLPTNAGTYTARFTVIETSNYKGLNATDNFVIDKQTVTEPTIESKVYSGSNQVATVAQSGLYTVTTNAGGTNAGNYDVVLTLTDSNNYKWSTTSEAAVTLTFTIKKVQLSIPEENNTVFTYTGSAQTYVLAVNDNYTISGNVQTNAGTYSVTVSINDTVNFEWNDETIDDLTYTFVINKADAEITYTNPELVYDPNEAGFNDRLEIATNNTDSEAQIQFSYQYKYSEEEAYGEKASGNIIESGYYYVTLSLAETANFNAAETVTFTVFVDKASEAIYDETSAELEDTLADVDVPESSYGEWELSNPVAQASMFSLRSAGSYVFDTLMDLEVTATFTPSHRHFKEIIKPIKIKVEKKTLDFNIESLEFTYDKTAQKLVYTLTDKHGATFEDITVNGNIGWTNAGTYNFTLEISSDYYRGSYSGEVVVHKAQIAKPAADNNTYYYTGNEITYNLVANDVYTITNNTRTVAGSQVVTVSLDDTDNYEWTDGTIEDLEFTFTINKATNIWTNAPTATGWTYGSEGIAATASAKFGTVNIEYKLSTADDNTYSKILPTNAGTYTVRFTVQDTENYSGLSETREFTVAKQVVNVPSIASKVYTGMELSADIPANNLYSVYLSTPGINVGNYDIILRLVDSNNYKWNTTESKDAELTFTITQATNVWTSNPTASSWIYGQSSIAATATSKFGSVVIEYKLTSSEDSAYSETLPTNAGAYTARFTVVGNSNYTGLSETLEFTISRAQVVKPTVNSTVFTYNGKDQVYVLTTNVLYTISGNVQSQAGNHIVTVALKDSENYAWTDGNNGSLSFSFVINKQVVAEPTIESKTYNGNAQTANIVGTSLYTVKANAGGTNAGNYNVVLSLVDSNNYKWSSTENCDVTLIFTINKAQVAKPVADDRTFIYTGLEQTYNIASSDLYTISGNSQTYAGNHIVTVTLKDTTNYEWVDGNSDSLSYTFTINKAQNSWTNAPTVSNWTYNEAGIPGAASAKFGSVTVEYKLSSAADNTYSESLPTEAGAYLARFTVSGTADYAELSETLEFSISQAENTWVEEPTISGWAYNPNGGNQASS